MSWLREVYVLSILKSILICNTKSSTKKVHFKIMLSLVVTYDICHAEQVIQNVVIMIYLIIDYKKLT